MPQSLSLNIDPSQVLGVRSDATLQEIRDAYRLKVKRHHPDHGGEDWAFRILVQSYEIMSTARVAQAAARPEPPRRPAPSASPPPPPPGPGFDFGGRPRPSARPRPTPSPTGETIREGVSESADDPSRVVDVEKLSLKHQIDQIWLVTEHSRDDRYLSCSLNLSWPSADFKTPPMEVSDHERVLAGLQEIFNELAELTRATSADSAVVDGRFSGWLSYPSGDPASEAFDRLRRRLHRIGLVVHQWSRDVLIPRDHR